MLTFLCVVLGCSQVDYCRDYVDARNACMAARGASSELDFRDYEDTCNSENRRSPILQCKADAYDRDCANDAAYEEVLEQLEECISK